MHPGASGGFEGMTQLLQLCTDPSRLGQKLLDALSSFSTANVDINPKSRCYALYKMYTVTMLQRFDVYKTPSQVDEESNLN